MPPPPQPMEMENTGFSDDYADEYLKTFRPLNAYAWSKQWVDRKIVSLRDEGRQIPTSMGRP